MTVPPLARSIPLGFFLALLNIGLGWVLIVGDPTRTSAPSFQVARELLPIQVWGLLFLLGGIICAVADRVGRMGAIGVAIGAGVHAFWASALWQAVASDNGAALTGAWVYTWLSVVHVVTGARLARKVP